MESTKLFILITLVLFLRVCTSESPGTKENLLPNTTICGIQNIVDELIIGGKKTQLKEFPWMALLEYKKNNSRGKDRKYFCGGALINKRYVLTAAHCLHMDNYTLINVRLGEYDTTSIIDCIDEKCAPEVLNIPIEEKIIHENYLQNDQIRRDDVALLRLKQDVSFSDFVRPICLPITKDLKEWSYKDSILVVAGWGFTKIRKMSVVKLKVELPVVDRSDCSTTYRTFGVTLNPKQMCAGGTPGEDSCRGDSGGPLMAEHEEGGRVNSYAVGILSFGPNPCGVVAIPAVYTRISHYTDWIIGKLNQ